MGASGKWSRNHTGIERYPMLLIVSGAMTMITRT
jgi:hypothetical protein